MKNDEIRLLSIPFFVIALCIFITNLILGPSSEGTVMGFAFLAIGWVIIIVNLDLFD